MDKPCVEDLVAEHRDHFVSYLREGEERNNNAEEVEGCLVSYLSVVKFLVGTRNPAQWKKERSFMNLDHVYATV